LLVGLASLFLGVCIHRIETLLIALDLQMNTSIEIFLMTSCLVTVLVSFWIAKLMVSNSLARVICLRVSTEFKINYKELETLCIDGKNKLFINSGIAVLLVVGYFSYRDYGAFYTLILPLISLVSILLSQQFILADTFAKERLDELLKFLLEKENSYKKASNLQLDKVQLLCNFIIDEYKYEATSKDTNDVNILNTNVEGFAKTKHHISNIVNDLSSGIKLLVLFIVIGLVSAGLRQLAREDSKTNNIESTKQLEKLQKLVEEKQKANQ
jgi:hypothetical protein